MAKRDSPEVAVEDEFVSEAMGRGVISVNEMQVSYQLRSKKTYDWGDPEEWVRARTIAFLVIAKGYPANRIDTEVRVPRRKPNDFADIVVYADDQCQSPYLVVENKAAGQTKKSRAQAIEQAFGNANSLRAPLVLYDEYTVSILHDVEHYDAMEREENVLGVRESTPEQYGEAPKFLYIAGSATDIKPVPSNVIENRIRKAHSIIWAGGRRDPLTAFDEWSKVLFAKVVDERGTPTGQPRAFQVGTGETTTAVATRVHKLFEQGCRDDPSIFPASTRIDLSDRKIFEVVKTIHDVSFTRADVDSIGVAFESFFGSVFRGELGQYFTMRQLARFTVAILDFDQRDFVIDPAAGSGGFLLEALLQVWHRVDEEFEGQPPAEIERIKTDFALHRVYGIEIHDVLARICKINLLLHHDGHANVEGGRSCLESHFSLPRLNPPESAFTKVVGNPPFGDEVEEGDEDHLGDNKLVNFAVAEGRTKVASEHVILERAVALLKPGGKLGFVVPDGLLNNQGHQSNCPRVREYLARSGCFETIVSLPDYAFRKSGAQNKTSLLFFRKFTTSEKKRFDSGFEHAISQGLPEPQAIAEAHKHYDYRVFLAEAERVGYTTTGRPSSPNDLYRADNTGRLLKDQRGTILGEYRRFLRDQANYDGRTTPASMALEFTGLWNAHHSHRLDPKYHLFKREEMAVVPPGWVRKPVGELMMRREEIARPEEKPDEPVVVMTISQTGEIRRREAGKGRNPPEWLGMYFQDSSSTWYRAQNADVVFSSIDLWKGCLAVVPEGFDGALVTKEFPIYRITDKRLLPEFLSCLLRSDYYQRAFRAITTGHSNRRRTQVGDFEALEICFPLDKTRQRALIKGIRKLSAEKQTAASELRRELAEFSAMIDGRARHDLPVNSEDGGGHG